MVESIKTYLYLRAFRQFYITYVNICTMFHPFTFINFFLSLLITHSHSEFLVSRHLKDRVHHLSKLIKNLPTLSSPCNDSYVVITEIPFGNSGNNIIEFIHGLWLSKVYGYTFVVPPWIRPALHPFNVSLIHDHFCVNYIDIIPSNSHMLEVTSEDSFFLHKLFVDRMYNSTLPALNDDLLSDMSHHFLAIYSALWSYPSHHIMNASSWLIQEKLGNSFNYTSIHKRSLEGGCNKLFSQVSRPADFPSDQIDMNHPSWNGNLRNYHPICEMPSSFALNTIAINNRSSHHYFIAYDGRGSVDDYISLNATFSTNLDGLLFPEMISSNARKFVDMFVAINGDFFILNPYSTYSFQIYAVRVCLGLESVPIMAHRDIYFKEQKDYTSGKLWVSWTSLRSAYEKIKDSVWNKVAKLERL